MWMLSLELSFFQAFAFLFSLVFCYHDNMLCNRNFLLPASPTLLFPKVLYWGLVPGTSQVSICNDRSHVVMIMLVASFAESQTGQTSPLWWNWPLVITSLLIAAKSVGKFFFCKNNQPFFRPNSSIYLELFFFFFFSSIHSFCRSLSWQERSFDCFCTNLSVNSIAQV